MSEINVAFTVTGYGALWARPVQSWLNCVGYASRYFATEHLGKLGGSGVTDRMYTHSAENRLVEQFLEGDYTHLFMTEIDMVLPHDAIVKLVNLDKDMASGIYFLRTDSLEGLGQPCLYKRPAASDPLYSQYGHCAVSIFPTNEPFQADCAGVGCLLLKRKVFEGEGAVKYPWFDLKEKAYGSDIYFSKPRKRVSSSGWIPLLPAVKWTTTRPPSTTGTGKWRTTPSLPSTASSSARSRFGGRSE
jgi:hypothetical protein